MPGAGVRLAGERDPRRQERHQKRGTLFERRLVRQVEEPLTVDHRALGIAAARVAGEPEHTAPSGLTGNLDPGIHGSAGACG